MHTLDQLISGQLQNATHLKLSCGLTTFPKEIFDLAESLEILDLSFNQLSALPDDFYRFKKLKIAFFSDNLFTELPEVLGKCEALEMIGFKSNQISVVHEISLPPTTRWLILTNNKIKELPASIGKCNPLQKVALAGNLLEALPHEMANCRNLELLRISANRFTQIPEWLFTLPKLSWLAVSGNPCSKEFTITDALQEISWNDLLLSKQLGEGASGIISKALLLSKHTEVAVKVFKGDVTSDGYPEDEMHACMAAGNHEHLVKLMAQLSDHPEQKQGLIFELIPPTYSNLGLPPDFKTCSRDTFKPGTQFTCQQILKISLAMAKAALHLHNRGIMHGDLYTHNTLVNEHTDVIFGDYGAASAYDTNGIHARLFQQIEVRAFGCLMDDLLNLVCKDEQQLLFEQLSSLRDQCMNETISERPLFDKVCERLLKL